MQYYGIDWFATACGLTAVYLLSNKNKIGFLVFMMASASWVTFGLIVGSWAVVTGSTIFFFMHLRGFLKWRRDEINGGNASVNERAELDAELHAP